MGRPSSPRKLYKEKLQISKIILKSMVKSSLREMLFNGSIAWSTPIELLVIEPVEDEDTVPSEEDLELKDGATEEEPQPTDYAVQALAYYSHP
ncbi:hypothetical protein B296_00007585 [Ensete ventricosum]|uniref:Uncharacterized protein n=1 Tax=Ensete ventricosum TaxID=4639 RepID=A0A426YBD6_ENSVE|nr:hypothetical protein B296_00007585 [Ensete ventricosum]